MSEEFIDSRGSYEDRVKNLRECDKPTTEPNCWKELDALAESYAKVSLTNQENARKLGEALEKLTVAREALLKIDGLPIQNPHEAKDWGVMKIIAKEALSQIVEASKKCDFNHTGRESVQL